MYCMNCGREVPNGNHYCPYCGAELGDGDAPPAKEGARPMALVVGLVIAVAVIAAIAGMLLWHPKAEEASVELEPKVQESTSAQAAASTTTPTTTQPTTAAKPTQESRPAVNTCTRYVSEPDGYANIRTGRGTGYDVAGTLPNGSMVVVTDLRDGWYRIYEGAYEGCYISSRTLSADYSKPAVNTRTRYVSEPDGYANVRTGRGTDYDVAGRLNNGTRVVVTDLKDGWYRICEGEYEGYYINSATLVKGN